MRCIVLAAGYATRLYPLTENFPKPLLTVASKPILDWVLGGVDMPITVVSNHKFVKHFEAWAANKPGIEILDDGTVDNEHRLGAVKDIQLAVQEKDDCLVIAGDNLLTFSLSDFIDYSSTCGTSCVMCHEETRLEKLRKTAVITIAPDNLITSYEEKPIEPKGTLAVPPFYFYRAEDIRRIEEALMEGCNADAPGSFAAWLSGKVKMHAWKMTGKRYDIGDLASYEEVQRIYANT